MTGSGVRISRSHSREMLIKTDQAEQDKDNGGEPFHQTLGDLFPDELEYTDRGLALTPPYIKRLRKYFSRYALYQDDELALKGWRRFIIDDA